MGSLHVFKRELPGKGLLNAIIANMSLDRKLILEYLSYKQSLVFTSLRLISLKSLKISSFLHHKIGARRSPRCPSKQVLLSLSYF